MNQAEAAATIDLLTLAGAGLDKAAAMETELAKRDEQVKQAAALVPGVVDALVEAGAIKPTLKAAAAQQLQTHSGTLAVLHNLCDAIIQTSKAASAAAPIGEGVAPHYQKSAAIEPGRITGEETAAAREFREAMYAIRGQMA